MKFNEMTLQERIKYLRKQELDKSQVEFGDKLSVSGSAVTGWEKGNRTPSESIIKLICKEYNVNYAWLSNGDGDIFNTSKEALIDRLSYEYKLSEQKRKLVERILSLSDEEINYFTMSVFGFEFIKKD